MSAKMDAIEKLFTPAKRLPAFRVGDQVKVTLRIVEGESERLQVFEGAVTRRRGHGLSATFTVRKISFGVGVERTFPLYSPRIESLEVVRSGHVRRSRLYFLRRRTGKAARLDEKAEGKAEGAPAVAAPAAPAPSAGTASKGSSKA